MKLKRNVGLAFVSALLRIYYPLIVLFLCPGTLSAQSLRGTNWVRINAERKDGSKIVDHLLSDQAMFKYRFGSKQVHTFIDGQTRIDQNYTIERGVLKIGDVQTFNIDSLNVTSFILTEISNQSLPDDKVSTFTFLNGDYAFDYLKEKGQLIFLSDSVIQCGRMFCPDYDGEDLDGFLMSNLFLSGDGNFAGSFWVSPDGKVTRTDILPDTNLSNKEIEKLKQTLGTTHWIVPVTPEPFYFKIDFAGRYMNFRARSIGVELHSNDVSLWTRKPLTLEEIG